MGYLVKYCIQMFLIYKARQILDSNKGTKGLQACIKIRAGVIKSSNQVKTNLIQKKIK